MNCTCFYCENYGFILPRVLDNTGKAELNMSKTLQLNITCNMDVS